MKIKKSIFYGLFIIILLSTELFHIEFAGGTIKPYHPLIPFVVLSLWRHIPKLIQSSVFWALFAFILANSISGLFSDSPSEAFKSLGLLALNMLASVAVALIVISRQISIFELIKLIIWVTIFSIIVGITQLAFNFGLGVNLGFTEIQAMQIDAGFATGMRYEANTFAKNLNTVFLLILPLLLAYFGGRKSFILFIVFLVGMASCLTRSAIYGLMVVLPISYIWFLIYGKGSLISKRPLVAIVILALTMAPLISVIEYINPYATHKISLFLDQEEIMYGASSGLRILSQQVLMDSFLFDTRSILIGNGWGQVFFSYGEMQMQAGGGELITALAYGGIIGGFFYLMYQFVALASIHKTSKKCSDELEKSIAQGVFLSLAGLLITGQINGSMIAPEYWMIFGMAMALSVSRNQSVNFKIRNIH